MAPLLIETRFASPRTLSSPSVPARLISLAWNSVIAALAAWTLFRAVSGLPIARFSFFALLGVVATRLTLDRRWRKSVGSHVATAFGEANAYALTGERLPIRATLLLVFLPSALVSFGDSYRGSFDSWPVAPAAVSLVREGNWELSEFAPLWSQGALAMATAEPNPSSDQLPYCLLEHGGGVYSSYPAGMTLFAVPLAALSRLTGANPHDGVVLMRLERRTSALVAAFVVSLFFLVALSLAPAGPVYAITMTLAVGSAMFSTVAQALWQHGGVALGALLALLIEFRRGQGISISRGASNSWRDLLGTSLQALGLSLALACRLSSSIIVVGFGAWILIREPRRAATLAVLTAACFFPWMGGYLVSYGHPFGPQTKQLEAACWMPSLASLTGVFLSPARGLFVYQPWLLIALLPLVPAFRKRLATIPGHAKPSGWIVFCLVVATLHAGVVGCWKVWWGGHCWGSRLLAEIVPLLALLTVRPTALLLTSRRGTALVAALACAGVLVNVPWIFGESWRWLHDPVNIDLAPERLWDWSDAPFLYDLNAWLKRPT